MARRSRSKVPAEWVRDASDRLAIEEGCHFDEAAGRRVCDFLEGHCRLSEGRWAGQPLRLIPWQRDWFMRLYGWKRPGGARRFQTSYAEVPKKSGKSPAMSGIACYHLVADGEGGPKIYLNACDREQARIVFEHAANMVRQSPRLARVLEVIDSRNRISCASNFGSIVANSAEVDSKDGRNASLVEFDELHRLPDRRLWQVFQGAGASREQPLQVAITTAGDSEDGVWFEQREYSEDVASGEAPDTTHLGIVYRALPTDDLDDPAVWKKTNPSLGFTITEEQFRRDMERARRSPEDWNDFLRKRFNLVASAATKFFDPERWKALGNPGLRAGDLAGHPAWLGLDLASVNDLAAMVAIVRMGERLRLLTRFWAPRDNVERLEREHRRPYRAWAEAGFITLTDGATIDYGSIRSEAVALCGTLAVASVGIDPYNATQLATQLKEEDGLPVEFVQQGYLTLSPATKEFRRLVDAGELEHDANPVMAWHVGNAVAVKDHAENIKLSKLKSREKIDGPAAAVDAVAAMLATPAPRRSVYQSRGLIFL